MTDLLNAIDRWRERQRWLPPWLDDADWKSWIAHAAITIVAGTLIGWASMGVSALAAWLFDWALPSVSIRAARWFVVGVYLVRELLNRTTWRPFAFAWRYKPLDGVMDVAGPALAVWLLP